MSEKDKASEKREYGRVRVEWPVVYKIGGNTLTGTTVNISNEGIMVESFLSSKSVSKILKILMRRPGYRLINGGRKVRWYEGRLKIVTP